MSKVRQAFVNDSDQPIYVSVEPWPECFELEPGDRLTLVYEPVSTGDSPEINFVDSQNLVVWPTALGDEIEYLINGEPGEHLSWKHKHR